MEDLPWAKAAAEEEAGSWQKLPQLGLLRRLRRQQLVEDQPQNSSTEPFALRILAMRVDRQLLVQLPQLAREAQLPGEQLVWMSAAAQALAAAGRSRRADSWAEAAVGPTIGREQLQEQLRQLRTAWSRPPMLAGQQRLERQLAWAARQEQLGWLLLPQLRWR